MALFRRYGPIIVLLAFLIAMNLTAIVLRNHMRKRYSTSAF